MKPSIITLIFIAVICGDVFGQTVKDSTTQTSKDSLKKVIPIFDLGRIEPYSNSVTTISSDDITWKDYRSCYDLLSSILGMYIRDLASVGHANQIVINGIDDKNVSIMIDGIPMNDLYTGTFNLWNLPADMIEKIEIVTGPQSTFYDGISAGGTINIVTKNYFNNKAYTRLRYSQGVDGYVQTDAMFAQNVARDLNFSFGITHYGFGSNKGSQNYIGRFDNSNNDAWNIRAKLRYNISDYFNISYSYLYHHTWTGLNGGVNYYSTPTIYNGLDANVDNSDSYEKTFNDFSTVTVAFVPANDSTQLITLTGYYFDKLREYRDEENRFGSNGIFKKVDYSSITKGIKAHYVFNTPINRFSIYLLAEDVNRKISSPNRTVGAMDVLNVGSFLSLSGFASVRENSLSYGTEENITLSDHITIFGGITINGETRASTLPSSYSRNEAITKFETGVQISMQHVFDSRISFFHQIIKNPIMIDTTGSVNYLKPNQYIFDGITASAHLQWNDFHLEGIANTLQQPKLIRNNTSILLYPEITLDGSAYYHGLLAKGNLDLRIGLRGRYTSHQTGMRPFDEFGVWIPASIVDFGPAATMDFFAVGRIGDAYIHFIWENLTGSQYLSAPVYPMYDRNIRFGVAWEFVN